MYRYYVTRLYIVTIPLNQCLSFILVVVCLQVQFILRQTGETSQNRRLAEAKSPKPQRRRAAIKKSLSFSGGAQSVSPSQSPRLRPLHDGIAEEEHYTDPKYVGLTKSVIL